MPDIYDILKIKNEQGEWITIPALKGDKGDDADVTAENIRTALGYTPADDDDVTTLESTVASQSSQIATKIDKSAQAEKTAAMTEEVGIDADGKLWSKPGSGGGDAVQGVKVVGTELTKDLDGKVDIPKATASNFGVVKSDEGLGVYVVADGRIGINPAANSIITTRSVNPRPIVPSNLNFAVKSALSDANRINDMTNAEKINACGVIGATPNLIYASTSATSGSDKTAFLNCAQQMYEDASVPTGLFIVKFQRAGYYDAYGIAQKTSTRVSAQIIISTFASRGKIITVFYHSTNESECGCFGTTPSPMS